MKDLTIANKIISEIAKKNKYITPVTLDDLPLFQEFFKKEPHTYGNSWTYVTQGVYGIGPNNLGYKYYDGKNLSMVCVYPKIEQPNINVFYWVRPMGSTVLDIIADFSKNLLKEQSVPTYVKKIFGNHFEYLTNKGFKSIDDFPWHTRSIYEDDTFPEQINNIKQSQDLLNSLPNNSNRKRLINKLHYLQVKHQIKINDDNFQSNAWRITQEFFNTNKNNLKKTNLSDEYDYFNMIFSKNNKNITKNIVFSLGQPIGFYVLEKQNEKYSCIYALITLRNKLKFMVDYVFLNVMNTLNTTYLNTGGSEDIGIHNFKQKFFPEIEQKMYWATNY